jgi:hypothetical protein
LTLVVVVSVPDATRWVITLSPEAVVPIPVLRVLGVVVLVVT